MVLIKAPEEIEVTASMIEAGMAVLWEFDPEWSKASETVTEIFKAMLARAHPVSLSALTSNRSPLIGTP